ncbi:trans-sialidase, putative [Trypanosoma cruzi]|uniref:Trans-sialidase, putative n=1 Tax=Trypanosoma cruzi (strain CL Brener) TaxID=353153 RepID=Q4E0M7_TRYCC|nr:trans-sialidase, putative [Trypanosoma cruzi]EAN98335.1 trans-sialidase, putative [Trypanosoma cruzi]|eukprot:XP_820186.1 trans-sialidase [Trypanosoma cruzi strain CL Brener]
MLSRVAAVKAPRIHNRRRGTGSSGRRREGRESEPQRPNVSRRVFTSAVLLLLFFLACAAAGPVQAQNYGTRVGDSYGRHSLEQLQRGHQAANPPIPGHIFRNPHLVNVNGMLLAIAGAQFNRTVGSGSASMQLMAHISVDGGRTWRSYAGPEDLDAFAASPHRMSFPSSFGPLGSIFAFVEGCDLRKGVRPHYANRWGGSGVESVIHFLETGPRRSGGLSMSSVSMSIRLPYPHKSGDMIGFLNDASTPITKMTDGTLVFPVQFLTMGGDTASTIMYMNPGQQHWTFANSATHAGCIEPSILEWEAGKIIMITSCKYGRRRVYESTDKGNTWTEAVGTLSRVWSNPLAGSGLHIQGGFITATIDGKKVILLTQLEYFGDKERSEIHLWLTDTNRIYQVGLLPTGNSATSSSLLYANDKLYCLYEASVGSDSVPYPLDLTLELQRIRHALSTWAVKDNALRQCGLMASGAALSRGNCSVPIPMAGLVGHLADTLRGDKWEDEYLGVNAVVRGAAKKAPSGWTFEGHDAGAEWPVGKQWPKMPFHFANYGFTLAATVSIHEVPKGITPLMGLKKMGKTTLLGLSYDNNMEWSVEHELFPKHFTAWELDKTYHVVLKMHDGVGSVYVDGTLLWNMSLRNSFNEGLDAVSHFYFGAYDEQLSSGKIHATVANVFLYNRPLNETEIGALNANKVTIPPPERKSAKASTATSPSVESANDRVNTNTQPTVPAPTPAAPQPTEQATLNTSSVPSGGAPSTPAEPKSAGPKPAEPKSAGPKPAEPKSAEPKPAEPKSAEPKPAEPKSAEPKPAEPKSAEPKPAESKSAEPKPAEPKSAEPKPAESKSAEPKPAEPKSAEPKPAEPKSAEPKPAEPKSAEPKPAEPKSAEPKPAESKSAGPKPAEPKSAEPKPAEPKSAEPKPAEPKSAEPKPAEPKSAEPKPAEPNSAEPKPAEPKSAEPKPAEPKSAEPKPAEPKSAEPKPAEPKSAEPKPAEPKSAEPKPAEPKSAEPKPAEPKSAEPKPAEPKSAEPKPAEPNAATSSAREGTADQPASATFSDGHEAVTSVIFSSAAITDVGASSSDDAQTVGTEGGAVMQADQPTQFSVGTPDAANAATHNAERKGQEGLHPQVKEAEAATLSSSL